MSNAYPKRRGRPRKEPKHYAWKSLHDVLQEMLHDLTFLKSGNKDFVKVSYGGTMMQLKKHLRRALNIIELYEEAEKLEREEYARKNGR